MIESYAEIPVQRELVEAIFHSGFSRHGIDYWCDNVRIGGYAGEYHSCEDCVDAILNCRQIIFREQDTQVEQNMTLNSLTETLALVAQQAKKNVFNPDEYDIELADYVIQMAIYGEMVFG